jgi:hypothetical protein
MKKKQTRILIISGEDYAALTIEQGIGIEECARRVEAGEELPEGVEADIEVFGEVDPKFIGFAQEFIDYDQAKTNNFYLLDEER